VLAGLPLSHAVAEQGEPESEALLGVTELVVALAPGAAIEDVAAQHGLTPLRALTGTPDVHLTRAPAESDIAELGARVSEDVRVRFAEPNFVGGAPEANPNYAWGSSGPRWLGSDAGVWTAQPVLERIGAPAAHATTTGEGTIVAVLDTGVQADHPALLGRLEPGIDLVDGDDRPEDVADGVDEDEDGLVDEAVGHGTHVSGAVLAVAPGARVLPIRVLSSDGRGFAFHVAEGLRRAQAAGADVVNLSLGSAAQSRLLEEVLGDVAEGVVVVASAGNDGSSVPQYPAASAGVLSVASVDAADARSAFSNHGWVDVAAPGEAVVSTYPSSGFAEWDGTSMAAPLVAGQSALLVAAGTDGAVEAILRSATPLDQALGAGRIDVAASLTPGDEGD
jgi:subtilisin family serine protease